MKPAVVEERVRQLPVGTVVCPADFNDVTNSRNASTQLARLAQKGILERIMRGIYWVPQSTASADINPDDPDHPFRLELPERINIPEPIGEFNAPDSLAIAEAIARSNHWEAIPAGSLALFMLGLPEGNPTDIVFASSGPSRIYELAACTITFHHTATRYLSGLSPASRLVVQALLAIGRTAVTDEAVASIASHLTQFDAECFAHESSQLPPWMSSAATRIRDEKEQQVRDMMSAQNSELTVIKSLDGILPDSLINSSPFESLLTDYTSSLSDSPASRFARASAANSTKIARALSSDNPSNSGTSDLGDVDG